MKTRGPQFVARLRRGARGWWVVAVVVGLIGWRWLWLWSQRPAHGEEIAAAYGSVTVFYGGPQSDRTGKRLVYAGTADRGFGLFLCDTATGRKINVRESIPTAEGDFCRLQVWPWAPDDSCFAYSDEDRLYLCDAETGRKLAEIHPPESLAQLAWVAPGWLVGLTSGGKLFPFKKQENGTWLLQDLKGERWTRRSAGNAITSNASNENLNGAVANAANAADENNATVWDSGRNAGTVWLEYQFNGPAWAITGYELTSAAGGADADPRDWQLLGSNDGHAWTVLDRRTNQIFSAREQKKRYEFSNLNPYRYHRLNITATSDGGGVGARVAEFQLCSEDQPGQVLANDENGPNETAAAAFDGVSTTKWFNRFAAGPGWLQYEFGGGAAWALAEYALTSGNDAPERDPRDWEFQGSNDGLTWAVLDRRAGEQFAARLETKSYRFKNVTPYRRYRLYITAARENAGQGIQLTTLDLGLQRLLLKVNNPDGGLARRHLGMLVTASSSMRQTSATNATDGNPVTLWAAGKTNEAVWLQCQFRDAAWAVVQYTLCAAPTDTNAAPRDWQLLGSNNGKDWTELDARTNELFAPRAPIHRYAVANQTPYWYYRLNITAPAGAARTGVQVAEFQLWSEDNPEVASANRENAGVEPAANAFDGDPNTKWFNGDVGGTGWLQYAYGGGEGQAISGYGLTSGNDMPERDPKDWELLASNDQTIWTTLDQRRGEKFESRLQTKSYSFANATPYRFYRLNITGKNGNDTLGLQLSELNLRPIFNSAARRVPPPPVLAGARNANGLAPGVNPLAGAMALTGMADEQVAWIKDNCLWSLDLESGAMKVLLDLRAALPDASLKDFCYSSRSGQFLLSCNQAGKDKFWKFNPAEPAAGLEPVPANQGEVRRGVWFGAQHDGWVAQQNNYLLIKRDAASEPMRLLPRGVIEAFTVSVDGQHLFILGTVKGEASAGIWQYDLALNKLSAVVSYADYPSKYARREEPVGGTLQLPGGEKLAYNIFPPADQDLYPHRKYPLVIGNTQFGVAMRGAHGRLWIPAVTATQAYVVVIQRDDWWQGLEKWGDNVLAVYAELQKTHAIDQDRVYLFGASAETQHISEFATRTAGLWKGIILLNPTGLPDFSRADRNTARPRLLISAGGEERQEPRLRKYQAEALRHGVLMDYVIHPQEGHHLVGNAAQLERTRALVKFVLDE